jgi:hypothetical protein
VKREGSNIRRRTFTALSVLSLLLCVATLGLWVRSYVSQDALRVLRNHLSRDRFFVEDHSFYSVRGQLLWALYSYF